jgi:uroporphyrin-III C-methyltransferase
VGGGPGDPELITVRGRRLLAHADVVVADRLAPPELLAELPPNVEVIDAAKIPYGRAMAQEAINAVLIERARAGKFVVRLKGGDPFVFGRGGEEMAELQAANIQVEVVPGITAGIAAPAYAGIPITHRDFSSSVTFVTGHETIGKYRPQINWQAIAQGSETIVIYMGVHNLGNIISELLAGGLGRDTPIALIRWGTRADQEELIGTLATIVEQVNQSQFEAPAIAVIGQVVNLKSCS